VEQAVCKREFLGDPVILQIQFSKFSIRLKHANTRQICARSRQNSAEPRQISSQLQKPKAALSKLSPIQAYSKPLPKRHNAKIEEKASKMLHKQDYFQVLSD
jgi:hypothetical protein